MRLSDAPVPAEMALLGPDGASEGHTAAKGQAKLLLCPCWARSLSNDCVGKAQCRRGGPRG